MNSHSPVRPTHSFETFLGGVEQQDEGQVDEEMREEAQELGRKQSRGRVDPGEPTAEERRIHETTHLPYRSWCADCVSGRGYSHKHISHDWTMTQFLL